MAALEGADALLIVTEWKEFRMARWKIIKKAMTDQAILIDGRNVYSPNELDGIVYQRIG